MELMTIITITYSIGNSVDGDGVLVTVLVGTNRVFVNVPPPPIAVLVLSCETTTCIYNKTCL